MIYNQGNPPTGTGTIAIEGGVISQVPPLELAATNALLQSADFTTTWAAGGGGTVTPNTTASPRGVVEADTLNDAVGTLAEFTQAVVIANDAVTRTFSVYLLASTSAQSRVGVRLTGGVAKDASIEVNPASGAVISSSADVAASSVEALSIGGASWIRVAVAVANNGSGNVTATPYIQPASLSAATQGNVIAWGAQLEVGSPSSLAQPTPTSQIPTLTAQVTRAAGAIPTWLRAANYTIQVFTATGANTYTAPANLKFARVTIIGGGGAGGGAAITGAGTVSNGGGGGAGATAIRILTAAQIGVSQTATVGAGGTGVAGAAGNAGGTSSFGALLSATGGLGGSMAGPAANATSLGGAGGTPASGDVNYQGGDGFAGNGAAAAGNILSGSGGASSAGGGARNVQHNNNGNAGSAKGSGGSGAANDVNQAGALTGGAGAAGIAFVEEFY